MNIFDVLPVYATKWQISTENPPRPFNEEELAIFESGVVVVSDYGLSVQITRKDGGMSYLPLVRDSLRGVGFEVDLTKAKLVTLCKPGEEDVYRIDC